MHRVSVIERSMVLSSSMFILAAMSAVPIRAWVDGSAQVIEPSHESAAVGGVAKVVVVVAGGKVVVLTRVETVVAPGSVEDVGPTKVVVGIKVDVVGKGFRKN